MLKIYECVPEVYINGEWQPCSIWSRTRAFDTLPEGESWYNTFAELVTACERVIVNASVTQTLFKNKTVCKISTAWKESPNRITEKNFRPVGFRWKCEEQKNVSMRYLIDNLPADDFAKWVAEKNISIKLY